ncbi:MAG: class I SAM-dependent methyltransferase [Actinomycetota bacterium]
MGRSFLPDAIYEYAVAHSTPPDEVQRSLIERTAAATGPWSGMQIGPDQGSFMSILTAVLRPVFVVEIGTFTGYSSLAVAKALPEGARMLCCDISEEWTAIAREHWEAAGVADRIELVIAPATETLAGLSEDQRIDLAFIDADKTGYRSYYDAIVPRLSEHGLLLIDNTLWSGAVAEAAADDDADTLALQALNDHIVADPRVEVAQLTIGDGVTVIRRR